MGTALPALRVKLPGAVFCVTQRENKAAAIRAHAFLAAAYTARERENVKSEKKSTRGGGKESLEIFPFFFRSINIKQAVKRNSLLLFVEIVLKNIYT